MVGDAKEKTKKCEIYTCLHGAHSLMQSQGAFAEQVALPDRVCYDPKQRCKMCLSRAKAGRKRKPQAVNSLRK